MSHSLKEIAEALGLKAVGASDILIDSLAEPADAGPDQLAMAMKPEFVADLPKGKARAALLFENSDWESLGLEGAILAGRPRYAMSGLSALMDLGQGYGEGIHPSAVIDPSAELGEGCSVGPFTVIGAGAKIGAGSVIGPQCFIGWNVTIGTGALIHSGVRIGARVIIGDRFVAQPNAIIGSDGFSFVTPEPSGVEVVRGSLGSEGPEKEQVWARIHSLGAVTIGDDVEVGSCTCIDRGTIRDTRIGNGVKFDNLVQIGHNVVIGDNSLICAHVGIAGSTVLGRNVVLAGQVGISDNLTVGDNVVAGGGAKIMSKVPSGRAVLGYPATKMDAQIESYKSIRRLPRLFGDVAELKKAVSKLSGND